MSSAGQKTVKALKVIGVVLSFRWIKKVRANRQAAKAGRPKPYSREEIFGDVVQSGLDLADEVKPGWRE